MQLFVFTVPQVYGFCSDPDQSGRIVLQGLVAAPRIIRLGESCSPWGRAGALFDLGKVNFLSYSVSSSSLNCEQLTGWPFSAGSISVHYCRSITVFIA